MVQKKNKTTKNTSKITSKVSNDIDNTTTKKQTINSNINIVSKDIVRILKDQRQELEEGYKGKKIIEREAGMGFSKLLSSKLIKVVTGIRRCGKSSIIYLLLKDKNFAYMNFDDERVADIDTDKIMAAFYEIYGKDFKIIFLDEVQNLENWELFVNRLHRAGFNVFITGSNSKLLSKELSTHLTGRHAVLELYPFNFKEYLDAVNFNDDIQTTKGIGTVQNELAHYLNMGGFPEVAIDKENPNDYIRNLYSKIIERDIISRYNISYKKTFKEISITLVSNPGIGIKYNKLKNQFGIKSEHTVKNYISYLEEAYIIVIFNRFSFKPIEIEKSNKKIYVIDNGIVSSVSTKFSEDFGHKYENAVAIELARRRSSDNNIELFYWKSIMQEEVDFVIKRGREVMQLIQVCYNPVNYETKEREIKALLKAGKELKCKDFLIITKDYEGEENTEWFGNKGKIKYMPLWKWLLER